MDPIRISTISSKGQTTVPVAIRRSLDLQPGDAIAYQVEGDKVSICKAAKIDLEWVKALEQTLTEWQDEEDDDL
ncbi:MAG: type II toxin-antitoxin system PrlF family antitoxin [Candidatus Latescibacteria bacterium]|nr:type II toxin-antitoxin system PrlF family antitoxin [Candidatus Latescibacterota bacterium]